jgi:hypothetical protein
MSETEENKRFIGGKRSRASSTTSTQPDDGIGDTQASNMSIDADLMCGICMGVLERPYTVIPCLHTFDKQCLVDWWKDHGDCPMCRMPSTSARFSFQLKGIIDRVDRKRKKKREIGPDGDNYDQQDICPFGRAPPPRPATHDDQDDDEENEDENDEDEDEDEEDEEEDDEPIHTTGDLVYPCPSCYPNNGRGYDCPVPIPQPTDADVQAMQLQVGAGYLVGPPSRQNAVYPVPIEFARQRNVVGLDGHVQCLSCRFYMPKDFNVDESQCSACKKHCCYRFDPAGCFHGAELRPVNDLNSQNLTPYVLFGYIHHPNLRTNASERDIFVRYLQQQAITVNKILEDVVELKREDEGDNNEEKWLADKRLCAGCVSEAARDKLYEWWIRERAKGHLDAAARDRDDCWYGYECRTQTHNVRHAGNLNHICDNTSAARRRGGAI